MKNILLTGSNGFLGKNISNELEKTFKITTLSRTSADYSIDLSTEVPNFNSGDYFDIVIHAAGKAHSLPSNSLEAEEFYKINYQGTVNLCTALEKIKPPKSFIFISTVAVYGKDFGNCITEDAPLKGKTPYALSKIKAEKFLLEWAEKNKVILTILRPSLIAGENAPGNLGDMVRAIRKGTYLSVANGQARKSVVMARDIANVSILAAEKGGVYNVCDDNHPSFSELEFTISNQLSKNKPLNIPLPVAKGMAFIGDILGPKIPINSLRLSKIINPLTFSNAKAKKELNWTPINVLENYKV